jgi:hypothetical protein
MKYSQVRDLARRYAAGALSQENYRSQRRSLIEDITSGRQALTYRDDEITPFARHGNIKLFAVAAIAILLIGLGFIAAWKAGSNPQHKDAATEAVAVIPTAPQSPGSALVREFVETNDWNDGSVQDFTRRWHALPAADQNQGRADPMYGRLVSELRQQLSSEKAITGTGGTDAHLARLQSMAQTLGINDTP